MTWDAYELFKVGENGKKKKKKKKKIFDHSFICFFFSDSHILDSNFAPESFTTFIPLSAESDARTRIIYDFFDLLAAIAAHSKYNGFSGRKLSRYAGWWAFEQKDAAGQGFDAAYRNWASAANATSHLFFAYLRSIAPDVSRGVSSISSLPIALQTLLNATEYPPGRPDLLQVPTTKVVLEVNSVSPEPFALLRRTRNFDYGTSDPHLQELTTDDPVKGLTDECRRVLRCIASVNQSNISSTKTSSSLGDAAWSRFEDVGFGEPIAEEQDYYYYEEEEDGNKGLGVIIPSRPTTPSWADFMNGGGAPTSPSINGGSSLPKDQMLPPIPTSSPPRRQSGRQINNMNSTPTNNGSSFTRDRGRLASISVLELDDTFWWTWITSLSGEESPARKAVFGRCALVETLIPDAKWVIIEEQVKGSFLPQESAPSTTVVNDTSAKNRGLFGGLGSRKGGKLGRSMSSRISKSVSAR